MGARSTSASPPLRLLSFPTPSHQPTRGRRVELSDLARAVMRLETERPHAAALVARTVERMLELEC